MSITLQVAKRVASYSYCSVQGYQKVVINNFYSYLPIECKCGDLMLINESVLAICLSYGEWYPIPGHHWTLTEAKVACRQLGKNPIGMNHYTRIQIIKIN